MPTLTQEPERIRFLSTKQRLDLLTACESSRNKQLFNLVSLALNCGLRKREISTLTESQVDFEEKTVTLISYVKNSTPIILPLTDKALKIIRQQIEYKKLMGIDSKFVFAEADGSPIGNFKKAFRYAVERAGIEDFTFHDLRHDFATRLRSKGVALDRIQHLLNHSSEEMTKRYAHLRVETLRESVELI